MTMSSEVEKAAERVARLRAQAEKVSVPLAEAEARLLAAEEEEAARRKERDVRYCRQFLTTWREQADEAVHSGDEAHARFLELIATEPWFVAYTEFRAARYKRMHVLTEAQSAQSLLGEVSTVPEPRLYSGQLLEEIARAVEQRAAEIGAQYAEELRTAREEYVKGTD